MGVAFCLGHCIACGQMITFNPVRVPSIRVRGEKEPLCRECAQKWIALHPEAKYSIPSDAYEACDETELI